MNWYGKEIYCRRGETFSLDVAITNRDNTPYRISADLENVFLLLTVSSDKYVQKDRYVLNNWINLANFPKVNDMTILNVNQLPDGDSLVRNRVLHSNADGKYYIYDDESLAYKEYGMRLIHTFQSEITNDWIDKTYEYTLTLVSGELDENYVSALLDGRDYDSCPFTNIDVEFEIIPKTKIYVESKIGGAI